ncbi:MAG TPA: branched-chain amino acid aminotransferase [Bacteroidia bacterium]|nr:branched-chain amino acid aminotransferase [Bacteroidia bacterium]
MLTAASIDIKKVSASRLSQVDFSNLSFGKVYSDHMFIAEYKNNKWNSTRIVPYDKIQFTPAMSALHYGQAIFEGFKAYRSNKEDVRIFRPLDNHRRMNRSAVRMAMPEIPEEIFMEGLTRLIDLDRDWIPSAAGTSLYIRPVMFGTEEHVGVKPSETYTLAIITGPVGKYYNVPLKVLVETEYTRAGPGGVGYAKAAGNYGRSLLPAKLAQEKGYHQLIWTDAEHHRYIEESGTMNVAFVIDNTLVTPPAGSTILEGITRDSILTIAKDLGIKSEVRKIAIDEVIDALSENRLQEAFGAGTAATIAHIVTIGYNGKDYSLPAYTDNSLSGIISAELDKIWYGEEDKFGWMWKV